MADQHSENIALFQQSQNTYGDQPPTGYQGDGDYQGNGGDRYQTEGYQQDYPQGAQQYNGAYDGNKYPSQVRSKGYKPMRL